MLTFTLYLIYFAQETKLKINMKDAADKAGVSISTVSRVLSDFPVKSKNINNYNKEGK